MTWNGLYESMMCTKEGLEQDFKSISRATVECFKRRNRVVWWKVQGFLESRNGLGEMLKCTAAGIVG
jgi:hypothetical protein